MTDTDESWTGGPSCSECPRSDCICAALERVRREERERCAGRAIKYAIPLVGVQAAGAIAQAIRSDGGYGDG